MAGTALSIHGLIAVASQIHEQKLDPASVLSRLGEPVVVDGRHVDYFSYQNPTWKAIGVLVDTKGRPQLRMSFQSRRAMAEELLNQTELVLERVR